MKDGSLFDDIKGSFVHILESKNPVPVDTNVLFIDYSAALDDRFERYMDLLQEQSKLLLLAKENDDDIEMLSSLLKIRTHAMSLSSFFDAIVEDAEIIIKLGAWPKIPDGYKTSEGYNNQD
ncbi:hypothetical protein [Aeromonas sp. AE23HZ002T15]